MKSVCIFAGANKGTNKAYSEIAHSLGRELVKNNLSMVYGGGSVGLMNEIANEVLKNKGKTIFTNEVTFSSSKILNNQNLSLNSLQSKEIKQIKKQYSFLSNPSLGISGCNS